MKKLFAIAMTALLLLTACAPSSSAPSSSAPVSSAPDAPSSEAPAAQLNIGVLQLVQHPSLDEIYDAFAAELIALGYDASRVKIDYQNGQGDPTLINSIAQKFVGDKVDMMVAIATPAAQGCAAASSSIPIVFSAVTDPIAAGLTASLEKPDANATGTSDAIPADRILSLADELTPGIKTYGFIYNLGEVNSVSVITQVKAELDKKGLSYIEATVGNSGEVTTAAQTLLSKVDAIFCPIDNTVAVAMPNLAQIANEAKIPVYVAADSMVADGGLATVGVNYTQLGKQTAQIAARILEGQQISDTPVEVLTEYSVAVNAQTAKALGVDVSKYTK